MSFFQPIILALALAAAGAAQAQGGERGSVPPGQSRDGAAPAEGAIKGGAILPGETGGMPDREILQSRCAELSGTLRDECLKQQRSGASGATQAEPMRETQPSPPVTTPPQNPR